MKSIQEIFTGQFGWARSAVVQKCRPKDNLNWAKAGYAQHWPTLPPETNLIVLAIGESRDATREIWVGKFLKEKPTSAARFKFYVEEFIKVGILDKRVVSDANFFGTGRGGGSRVKVVRLDKVVSASEAANGDIVTTPRRSHSAELGDAEISDASYKDIENAVAQLAIDADDKNEVLRQVWCRTNAHNQYRQRLLNQWEGRCALTGLDNESLLVASHMQPWSKSEPSDQIDMHNGLVLLSPIDKLFDRGYITFNDDGAVLLHDDSSHDRNLLDTELAAFGLSRNSLGKLRKSLNDEQKRFMRYHRDEVFGR
jgi:hypothetical protein